MKKIHLVSIEIFSIYFLMFLFFYLFASKHIYTYGVYIYFAVFTFVFIFFILNRLVYLIENYEVFFPLFSKSLKDLKPRISYELVELFEKKALIRDWSGNEIMIRDMMRYIPYLQVGDYLIIRSFSPLKIYWIRRESKIKKSIELYV